MGDARRSIAPPAAVSPATGSGIRRLGRFVDAKHEPAARRVGLDQPDRHRVAEPKDPAAGTPAQANRIPVENPAIARQQRHRHEADRPVFADSREWTLPVDPDDTHAIEDALRRVLVDPELRDGLAARAKEGTDELSQMASKVSLLGQRLRG